MLDQYLVACAASGVNADSWHRNILMSSEYLYILVYCPEIIEIPVRALEEELGGFSDAVALLSENAIVEVISTPVVMFPQFLFVLYFGLVFISMYFNYFTSALKEEATVDADYLVGSSTVESEKEITAFDDMILAFVILLYIFGWYFYIHCWSLVSAFPEIIFLFYLFPCLYFIIFGIPTILAYVFGIQFLVYLRGVSSSPSLAAELMFDYIGVVVFYVRILIQGVRLVLMLLTLASLNELIMQWSIPQKAQICPEYF
jgi:hypothetical protein